MLILNKIFFFPKKCIISCSTISSHKSYYTYIFNNPVISFTFHLVFQTKPYCCLCFFLPLISLFHIPNNLYSCPLKCLLLVVAFFFLSPLPNPRGSMPDVFYAKQSIIITFCVLQALFRLMKQKL